MSKAPYPKEIAPQKGYTNFMTIKDLLKVYPDLAVVRRCDMESPYADSATGEHSALRPEVIPNNVIGLSVNLVGGVFEFKLHGAFNPETEIVYKDWDGETYVNFPLHQDEYSEKDPICPIFFQVSKIDKLTLPYTKTINQQEYASIKNKASEIQKKEDLFIEGAMISEFGKAPNGQTDVRAYVKVNHHPTILNYWHVQFDCYEADSEVPLPSDVDNAVTRKIRRKFREQLRNIAVAVLDGRRYHINRRFYFSKPPCACVAMDSCIDVYYRILPKGIYRK